MQKIEINKLMVKEAYDLLNKKGYSGPFDVQNSYVVGEKKVSLVTTPNLNEVFIIIFDQNDHVVEASLKTYTDENGNYIVRNLYTGDESEHHEDDVKSFENSQVVNAMASCPPGQEWREYNCTNDPELNWVCYAGCIAGLRKPQLCINLCTTNIKRCSADCFPIGGVLV
jgi:hypothetical protein